MAGKLSIYTEDFFIVGRLKNALKTFFGKNRGPKAVFESLRKGLSELDTSCQINEHSPSPDSVASVLSGVETLKWAIAQKQRRNIKAVIAGPNIVISPADEAGLLQNSAIDKIIVPSEWVKNFYLRLAPELSSKIHIWPAGADLPTDFFHHKTLDFLVYDKVGNGTLATEISDYLEKQNYKTLTVGYNRHTQAEYFKLLNQAKHLIYLSRSDSQSLALFEAWARNIPSLIWEAGEFNYQDTKISGQISAPYLTPGAGMAFNDFLDFQKVLPQFLNTEFSPRAYIEQNFTHALCAQKYLDIVNA